MIEITDVSITYASGFKLEPLSMILPSEQTHVFLGSSGSGKTTLLKAMLGLKEIDQGSIRIFSQIVNCKTQPELAKIMGYVPQEGGLFPHMTGTENVCLPGKIGRMPAGAIAKRLAELSELVGLEDAIMRRYPSELSGGQRQRMALMRALFTDPKLIILDEPLGALDPLIRSKLQEDLKKIFNRLKKLVVIVTHDLGEAAYFGHSVSLFHEGRLLQHSSIAEMVRHPRDPFVTEFLNAYRNFDYREMVGMP